MNVSLAISTTLTAENVTIIDAWSAMILLEHIIGQNNATNAIMSGCARTKSDLININF